MASKIDVVIRDFAIEDMEASVNILQRVSIHAPHPNNMFDIAKQFLNNERCYACVAECNGLIIGIGCIFMIERIRGGSAAIIEDVAVHEAWSCRGVGKLIMEKLIDFAKSNSCFKITLVTNNRNIIFYEKLGFTQDLLNMKLILG